MKTAGLRWLMIPLLLVTWSALSACDDTGPGAETESDCADGVDNDGDGQTDCDDPDCIDDCANPCGDGTCDVGEDRTTCPDDCVLCGDTFCDAGEDRITCPDDCILCGDTFCDAGEDRAACPEDCAVCGDTVCDAGEDRITCPDDCILCGDDYCDAGEDRITCPDDCAVCGDTFCDAGEDRVSCPDDCASCGDTVCDTNEDRITCPDDCILCGDTFCDTGETIANCPVDCATVLLDEDFSTWVPAGWAAPEWFQITQGTDTWAECTNSCISQDAVMESVTFSTLGFTNVWVSFTQQYQFAGTGVQTGLYLDAPPDYYTVGYPTDDPVGAVAYDISTEAANRSSVRLHIAVTCLNTSQCFLNDQWLITDVLVWAW